ncbi:MAG: helicase, partial [Bacillota bacterium]
AKLASKGSLTWRWLAYLLEANPAVDPIRQVIRRRLMDASMIQGELKRLNRMLVTLHEIGIVILNPPPPEAWRQAVKPAGASLPRNAESDEGDDTESSDDSENSTESVANSKNLQELMGLLKLGNDATLGAARSGTAAGGKKGVLPDEPKPYEPITATPTDRLKQLMVFRAVHPLYGVFLMDYLGIADNHELIQILESLLEMPGSVAKHVRVPWHDELPPGRLSTEVVDPAILTRGLATQEDLYPQADQSDIPPEFRKYPVPLAQKMRMLFESTIDHAGGLSVTPVWVVGDMLTYGGSFDKYVRARDLVKQEGIIFKHLLRMVLLCDEFAQLTPRGIVPDVWQTTLANLSASLTTACRTVDPQCTDEMLEELADDA